MLFLDAQIQFRRGKYEVRIDNIIKKQNILRFEKTD